MKLLIVTSLKEHQQAVTKILYDSGVTMFSATPTIGFKNVGQGNLADNWFAHASAHADSVFLFSFTGDENANQAVSAIRKYNEEESKDFPVHAFVLPVENASHT